MQEKKKMSEQIDENFVQVQQHSNFYFCIKIIFKSWFFWLIWPFKGLSLMILTMTIYHENLPRDSFLSLLFIVKFFSSLQTKMILKKTNENLLRITRYLCGTITRRSRIAHKWHVRAGPLNYQHSFLLAHLIASVTCLLGRLSLLSCLLTRSVVRPMPESVRIEASFLGGSKPLWIGLSWFSHSCKNNNKSFNDWIQPFKTNFL